MESDIFKLLLQTGGMGAALALIMWLVVKPLLSTVAAQLENARQDRIRVCASHDEHLDKVAAVLDRLVESTEGLSRKINGE